MKNIFAGLLVTTLCLTSFVGSAEIDSTEIIDESHMTAFEHQAAGVQDLEANNWRSALNHFTTLQLKFANSQAAKDSLYFQALCNYHLMEYDVANRHLSDYLNNNHKIHFFEEALEYKLAVADKFASGAKKHLFDSEKFPKIAAAKEDALFIYDEIIAMVPNHDLAAKAFLAKGELLKRAYDYKDAQDCFSTLIKRFPKHKLTPSAYLGIAEILYSQSHTEFHNPDLLDLANINLDKFVRNFPRDEKVDHAKNYLALMQEIHAKGLYDTGMFYERTKKPQASVIYYVTALEKFPNAPSASKCRDRLSDLSDELKALQVSEDILK